jgi:hypothetical protein
MRASRIVGALFAVTTVTTLAARPIGESDAAFIARTIGMSPMSAGSHVSAHLTDCSLIIDTAVPGDQKRVILPLTRLDERSFKTLSGAGSLKCTLERGARPS